MARSSNNNGKLTSGNRSAVRMMLATGATLATLISAQMFAANAALQSVSTTAAVTTTTQNTANTVAASPTTTTDDEITSAQNSTTTTVYSNSSRSSIFSVQSQPVPGSRSSR